jgi:hypothetical protein
MTYLYENNAAGTLASGISNSATSLTLNAGQASLFPNPAAPDTFFATLTDAATQTLIEIVSVTSVAGNIMSIVRAQDGTAALSWNAGDILSQRVIAAELRQWQGIVPIGGIIMWSGASSAIPENWALCNGTDGTPNLEGQFVIGAGGAYNVGATGGSANALLAHTHAVNDPQHNHAVNDPSHTHNTPWSVGSNAGAGPGWFTGNNSVGAAGTVDFAFTGILIDNAPTGVTVGAVTGATTTANSLPPYYALCYIMRVT